jgi:Xaa-Pro aminopeptidase
VDDVARDYIEEQGFGDFFFHRTGHSIGTDVHGTGANMDNFESHDERRVIPRTGFSIEPGIYLPEFGIRSEVNVYVGDGFARITGQEQENLIRI